MKVVVALEARFERTPDGAVWTLVAFAYPFWTRYLDVFDEVCAVARVRDVPSVPLDWQRVDGEGVSCFPIPYYIGPWQYLFKAWAVIFAGAKGTIYYTYHDSDWHLPSAHPELKLEFFDRADSFLNNN